MRRQMAEYLDQLADDDDIKVVILRGEGGVFSTGADMDNAYAWYGPEAQEANGNGTKNGRNRRPSQRRKLSVDRRTFEFYHDFQGYPKVTVAEVRGYALGGGFELALMSEYRLSQATPLSACLVLASLARHLGAFICSSTV